MTILNLTAPTVLPIRSAISSAVRLSYSLLKETIAHVTQEMRLTDAEKGNRTADKRILPRSGFGRLVLGNGAVEGGTRDGKLFIVFYFDGQEVAEV